MRWGRPVRLALFCTLAASCAISSVLTLVSLNAGGGISLAGFDLLPVAAGYDRRARADLNGATPPGPEARRDAAIRSRAALAQFPYDTGAYLHLAFLETAGDTLLTPRGLAALQRSYDLVAVDPDFAVWRVGFALEHSQALPKALRATVRQEVAALWTNPRDRSQLIALQRELRNPAGRLSLALWINRLRADDAK
jgi:hypothetical protein